MSGVLIRILYALLLASVMVLSAWFSFSRFVAGSSHQVPDLTGKTVEEAETLALGRGLRLVVDRAQEAFDDAVPARRIRGQNPPAQMAVKAGQDLRVFLSLGPRVLRAPSLNGLTARTAALTLGRGGLTEGSVSWVRVPGPTGVISQGIPPGEPVAPDSRIDLLVNRGVSEAVYIMPDLIGRDVERVQAGFEARGYPAWGRPFSALRRGRWWHDPSSVSARRVSGLPPGPDLVRRRILGGSPNVTETRLKSHGKARLGAFPALTLALLAASCSSGDSTVRLTRELLAMPKEEAYARGDALVSKRKWETGRQYLRFVAENYANDPIGKQAALRLADSFFEEKTPLAFLEAQARYKDFRSRYPSHPKSDYALYRLAQVSDKQAEKPDRDQANTRLAASSYRELLQGYPGSPYAAEARARYRAMRDLLAEHEFIVARFYQRRGAFKAAKGRFDTLLSAFPEFAKLPETLYNAGLVEYKLAREEDAFVLWARLRQAYPEHPLVHKIPPDPGKPAADPPRG